MTKAVLGSDQRSCLSPLDSQVTMHVCECLCMTEKRWVREGPSINPRTGLDGDYSRGSRSVLQTDLLFSFLGHSSRMAISHFSLEKKSTPRVINLSSILFVCIYLCLYERVRISSPRFPVPINNSETPAPHPITLPPLFLLWYY